MCASAAVDSEPLWVVRTAEDEILFQCIWNACTLKLEHESDFKEHFRAHQLARVFDPSPGNETDWNMGYPCEIRRCDRLLESADQLNRHYSMHVFHALRQYEGAKAILQRAEVSALRSCGFPCVSVIVYDGSALLCEWNNCNTVSDEFLAYLDHVNRHIKVLNKNDRDSKKHVHCLWTDCTRTFGNKTNLRFHMAHHTGDKAVACPYCGTLFANRTKFYNHLLRKANDNTEEAETDESLVCLNCKKRCKSHRLLVEHCRRHVMSYICEYCGVPTDSPSGLQRHINGYHLKIRQYFCNEPGCSAQFLQEADLNRHRKKHQDIMEHKCEKCSQEFRWKKQLVNHMRSHETNDNRPRYACHKCPEQYLHGYNLGRHLQNVHHLSVPDGFMRFSFKICADGLCRLQTERYLAAGLAAKMVCAEDADVGDENPAPS